jgi:predicted amidohydrolase
MRVSVFQCAGGGLSPEQRLQRLQDAISGQQLDLVVCPELFMSGYNVGDALIDLAQTPDGPFARAIAALSRSHGTAIVYGYPERAEHGIYNSVLCIDSTGALLANHRKLLLPPGFESRYFEAGQDLTLFELNGIRCAFLVCYDVEYPESVRAAAEAGAELVIVPTALEQNWGLVANKLVPTRAFENGIWMIYANHAGKENGTTYFGGSCIVAPNGEDAARAGADETLISCDLDMQALATARERLPYLREVPKLRAILKRI